MPEKQERFERTGRNPSHYPPASQDLKFDSNMEFQTELRRRVNEYFRERPAAARRLANISKIRNHSILLLSLISDTGVLGAEPVAGPGTAVVLSLSMTGIGFNIMHDGGHRAFSERRWVNGLAAMTLDLIGASSYVWHWKHAMYHHNYVNVVGYDPDIDLGTFARFAPHQKRRWFHRWQHLYVWHCTPSS